MAKKKLNLGNNPLLAGPRLIDREHGGSPYREIGISTVQADPRQPRKEFDQERLKELAESIRSYGVLNPILVRPGRNPGSYELIAGERRLRAAKLAGLSKIPAIITQQAQDDQRTVSMQLVENLQPNC